MISRTPEEYEIFTEMDRQRYKDERRDEQIRKIQSKIDKKHNINFEYYNYRLMQEWEVPEWVKIKPEDPNKDIQEFGLGKR